ncbi:MAG: SIS domain-containing protein [archaeon]
MATTQPRLRRYRAFIGDAFLDGFRRNSEYAIEGFFPRLKKKMRRGGFRRILFTGMGCSAIVSDIIKGFFADQGVDIHVEVLNGYHVEQLIDVGTLKDGKTLVIVSSYSGFSKEPVLAYERMREHTKDIIFLTSGGRLYELARSDKVPVIKWAIIDPDREYPLFHVPQYFAILLDVFCRFGILRENYAKRLEKLADDLHELKLSRDARDIARMVRGKDIIMLATPLWHTSLLKLIKMHLNEIAMVPAHRNYFHEFCHSEVGVCSMPTIRQAIFMFKDMDDDAYTKAKMDNARKAIMEGGDNMAITIPLDQPDFLHKLFATLMLFQHITYKLGIMENTPSRELISRAAGNMWYNRETIKAEMEKG